jgi:3-hydroxymyristoyl/3-hydroxydecanoyl-(acyl carrier protein) dehydratase
VQDARFKRMVKPGDTVTIDVRYKEAMSKFHFITGRMAAKARPS